MSSANDSWKSLSSIADVVETRARDRAEFLEECRTGVFDDVLVIYRTFESAEISGRFDEEVVRSLPSSVKFLCHNGMS